MHTWYQVYNKYLVPDVEQVAEAFCDHEGARLPLPLKQSVGRHGGSHTDVVDTRRV